MSFDPTAILPFRKTIKYKKGHKPIEGSPYENKWDFVAKNKRRAEKKKGQFVPRA